MTRKIVITGVRGDAKQNELAIITTDSGATASIHLNASAASHEAIQNFIHSLRQLDIELAGAEAATMAANHIQQHMSNNAA